MTEKPIMSPAQLVYALINFEMDKFADNYLTRSVFEKAYVKKGYRLDWNKRLNMNGEWVDKGGDVE